VPPVGLPEWKQPSFDDDDNVHNESILNKVKTSIFEYMLRIAGQTAEPIGVKFFVDTHGCPGEIFLKNFFFKI